MDDTSATQSLKLPDPVDLAKAVSGIAERSQRLVSDFVARQANEPVLPSSVVQSGQGSLMGIAGAFFELTQHLMSDPARLMNAQFDLWRNYLELWQRTSDRLLNGTEVSPVISASKEDKRFRDKSWSDNAVFDFIKQSYLLSAQYLQTTVRGAEGLDSKTRRKVDFYTRQFLDALAPSNFVATNPEVLRETIESGGENLLKGLDNMLQDLERGKGQLAIKMCDPTPFRLGETIATTPGKIIFQNELLQLIQYSPMTETVKRRPLLIVPPWINKYYILDLTPQKSFVHWAVEQGQTVFVISWVNPDEKLASKTFDDYMAEGLLAAVDAVEQATGEADLNAVGYCIGGTLLATTLAYLKAKGDQRIKSATYFTTLIDFAEVGDISVFIDEDHLEALEARMRDRGYLDGQTMAAAFNMLRANDLIWSFVINNYLLGREPFPFDLLQWNSDSTRLPFATHSFYLRKMYKENQLVRKGGISMRGVPIDLTTIDVPSFLLATREDHIAPWRSTYIGTQTYSGPVTFCLAASGHVAGVINPPADQKYGYWVDEREDAKLPPNPEAWLEKAQFSKGSWWIYWGTWIEQFSGGEVPARIPGSNTLPALEDAPGSYVKVTAA